jgi:hypothetical protein
MVCVGAEGIFCCSWPSLNSSVEIAALDSSSWVFKGSFPYVPLSTPLSSLQGISSRHVGQHCPCSKGQSPLPIVVFLKTASTKLGMLQLTW